MPNFWGVAEMNEGISGGKSGSSGLGEYSADIDDDGYADPDSY